MVVFLFRLSVGDIKYEVIRKIRGNHLGLNPDHTSSRAHSKFWIGMPVGVFIGTFLGVAMNNIGLGVVLGAAIGVAIGLFVDQIVRTKEGTD